MTGSKEALKDEGTRLQAVAAGATAGIVSRFVIAPLDVVKIRLQLQSGSPSHLSTGTSALSTVKRMLATEGITAFWKGNIPAELLYVCYSAAQFATYRSTTLLIRQIFPASTSPSTPPRLSSLPPSAESFIAGAVAGAVATTMTYPLDLLRTRFAAQGSSRVYSSLSNAIRTITFHEGTRGLFRGLGPTLGQIMPYMGIFFVIYEAMRPTFAMTRLPWGSGDATAAMFAGILAKTAVFPMDLVRKRIQVQGPTRAKYAHGNVLPEYSRGSAWALVSIFRSEGIRGLYRGLTISLVKVAPATAVMFWTYERAMSVFNNCGTSA